MVKSNNYLLLWVNIFIVEWEIQFKNNWVHIEQLKKVKDFNSKCKDIFFNLVPEEIRKNSATWNNPFVTERGYSKLIQHLYKRKYLCKRKHGPGEYRLTTKYNLDEMRKEIMLCKLKS